MQTQDFDFFLPENLIAQHPTQQRSASRLLLLGEEIGAYQDAHFFNLPNHINANDLLIFNDTRVIKARLFGKKASGGATEVLIERIIDQHRALAHVRASRAPKPGTMIELAGNLQVEMMARHDDLFELYFHDARPVAELLEKFGQLPLPPYITHHPDSSDETRYQTVYAKHAGAVAAPTAGLHFDEALLKQLEDKGIRMAYVTLHVGAGTFQPVKVDNIEDHKMHSERYVIPAETAALIAETRKRGGKIIAIGTTALRALESAAQADGSIASCSGETSIFITPGYQFKIVDQLLTNFHLPKSTLLMLVSAFAGFEQIKQAYQHAVAQQYRFFSYGDAMLLARKTNECAEVNRHTATNV